MMETTRKLVILVEFTIPLVGARGGKINLSLNKSMAFIKPKDGAKQIPPWAFKKRNREHFRKYVYEAKNDFMEANHKDIRYVKYTRIMTKGSRLWDATNFAGGIKQIEDVLVERNWLYDDDVFHVLNYFSQDGSNRKRQHALNIKIARQVRQKEM